MKVSIVTSTGDPIKAADKVGFVNHPATSIFRAVDFTLQNTTFTSGIGQLFPYKMMLDLLTNRSTEFLESSATGGLFFKDTASQMDSTEPTGTTGVNTGLVYRYDYTKNGKSVILQTQLPIDLAQTMTKYLPFGLDMSFRFYPQNPAFSLMCSSETDTYQVKIHECRVGMRVIEPTKELLNQHDERLKSNNMKFWFLKSECKWFSLAAALTCFHIDQVFTREVPRELIIAFVSVARSSGSQKLNPYKFEHLSLNRLSFSVEGVIRKEFYPDYTNTKYTDEYMSVYEHDVGLSEGGLIHLADYASGYTIYRIPINPGMQRGKLGQSRLEVNFETALTESVLMILYAKFDDSFEIDKTRTVLLR